MVMAGAILALGVLVAGSAVGARRVAHGEREATVFRGSVARSARFIGGCIASGGRGVCIDPIDPRRIDPGGPALAVLGGEEIRFVLGAGATARLAAALLYPGGPQRSIRGVRGHDRRWRVRLPARLGHPTRLVFFVRYGHDDAGFLVALTRRAARPAGPHCSATNRHLLAKGVRKPARTLAPDGAVAVVICRYAGLNPRPRQAGRLQGERHILGRTAARRLARRLNRLKPGALGPRSCPLSTGDELIATFHYARADPVRITIETTGCRYFSNGRDTRTGYSPPGPEIIRQLAKWTR